MGALARNGLILSCMICYICDVLHDLVPFTQLKNVKNTHGEVLLLAKLQALSVQLY